MSIRRYFYNIWDDLATPSWYWDTPEFTTHFKIIDPELYDVKPTEKYKQILEKQAEEEIKVLEDKLAKAKEKLKGLKSD